MIRSSPSRTKIGCSGFPVARARYWERFPVVELNSTFYRLPRRGTAERWRQEAPANFEFAIKASQAITHPETSPTYRLPASALDKMRGRLGHFRGTEEVFRAWLLTLNLARILRAKVLLFQTPASFYPNADTLRDMYGFLGRANRDRNVPGGAGGPAEICFAWEPRGSWDPSLIQRICGDLRLIHVRDPLKPCQEEDSGRRRFSREGTPAGVRYFRLHGAYEGSRIRYGYRYTQQELKRLSELCERGPAYVFFNNTSMWEDARRFQEMTAISRTSSPLVGEGRVRG